MLQLNLAASIAQNESESISENMKWSYRNRAAQGKFKAAKGKYFGFNTDDGYFHPDENSRIVKEMFERYAAGESLEKIAEKVNEKGALTTRGNPWRKSSVKCILQNEVYVGDVQFQKRPARNVITKEIDPVQARRYIKDHHEGIVSRGLWNLVQRRLEAKKTPEFSSIYCFTILRMV